jgi:glucosamine-6-phosphate deaminase
VRIRIFRSPRAVARALARRIAEEIAADPHLVLGLAAGRTPVLVYEELVALARHGEVDLSGVTTFNLDEFVGIPPAHPGSYRSFMARHLFDHVPIAARRRHLLNGGARDPDAESERYERAIARAGGIDVQILGLGVNGHIGFNEPAAALHARTHRSRLTASSRQANRALFDNDTRRVPREALSMGMATILQARRIIVVATGQPKAACVERMIAGPVTTRVPASLLQLHRNVEVWVDRAAASRLRPPAR